MTTIQTIDDMYLAAWTDLGQRIHRGLSTLRRLPGADRQYETTDGGEMRLARKIRGLDLADREYRRLDRNLGVLAPGTAWRNFTATVFEEYQSHVAQGSHLAQNAAGLALALEYQRGYGPWIDAPTLLDLVSGSKEA